MKKQFFKTLAKVNKAILPSFTKKNVDLAKASKLQLALFAYKLWVTKNALDWAVVRFSNFIIFYPCSFLSLKKTCRMQERDDDKISSSSFRIRGKNLKFYWISKKSTSKCQQV